MNLALRTVGAVAIALALPAAVLAAAPENDLPPGIEVTTLPFTHSTDTAEAAIHALEPNSTCTNLGSQSVWYTFTAPADLELVADTIGSDFDTVVDVFQGTLSANPDNPFDTLTVVGCNDNDGLTLQSRLTFSVVLGETYLIRVNTPLNVTGTALTFNLAVAGPGAPAPSTPPTDVSGPATGSGSAARGLQVASLLAGLLTLGLILCRPPRRSGDAPRS
jgi:hypothetical protein